MMRILIAAVFLAGCATLPSGPARSDELFGRVRPGMTEREIVALLGAPDDTMRFPRSGHDSLGYFYWDGWGTWSEFSVTLDAERRALFTHTRRFDGGDRD